MNPPRHNYTPEQEACDRCDHGWRTVGQGYIDAHVLPAPPPLPSDATAAERARHEQAVLGTEAYNAAVAGAVYPCKTCRPTLFFRWAGRHFLPDHNRSSCSECREADTGKWQYEGPERDVP